MSHHVPPISRNDILFRTIWRQLFAADRVSDNAVVLTRRASNWSKLFVVFRPHADICADNCAPRYNQWCHNSSRCWRCAPTSCHSWRFKSSGFGNTTHRGPVKFDRAFVFTSTRIRGNTRQSGREMETWRRLYRLAVYAHSMFQFAHRRMHNFDPYILCFRL